MSEREFDPYHVWLGIPPEEQPPNYYRLLGIKSFEDAPAVIENAADRQMGHLHRYESGEHGEQVAKLMSEVSRARRLLAKHRKERLRPQVAIEPRRSKR
jgi:hypothetical protein